MLRAVVWDVQHGLAVYLKTPSRNLVVDLGVGSHKHGRSFSPLLDLRSKGVAQLDCVIITHPHRDHLDDIANFNALSPTTLMRPQHLTADAIYNGNATTDREVVEQYLTISSRFTGCIAEEKNPFRPANNGGADIRCFVPKGCATSNLNNHSIVTVVAYAGLKLVIPGDNEPPSWAELLGQRNFRGAVEGTDILIAPHHGRESGFSKELFEVIAPRLTIVSDGDACDTTAVQRYSAHSKGMVVKRRAGGQTERKCVTTRNDGPIVVSFDADPQQGAPKIRVDID
jgi:beta-lactamase superfamily II metal-dependent hydrolase